MVMLSYSWGRTQRIRLLTESPVAAPVLSLAGVKRARLFMIRQVAESSALDPLDEVIVQSVTRPLGPTSSLNPVVPCSSARIAEGG